MLCAACVYREGLHDDIMLRALYLLSAFLSETERARQSDATRVCMLYDSFLKDIICFFRCYKGFYFSVLFSHIFDHVFVVSFSYIIRYSILTNNSMFNTQ